MRQCGRAILASICIFRGLAAPVPSTSVHKAQIEVHDSRKVEFASDSLPVPHDLVVQPVAVDTRKTVQNTSLAKAPHAKPASLVQGRNAKTWIKKSSRVWKLSCDTHIKKHPDEIQCPGNCPFVRAEPTRLCQFKCVPASHCNSDNPLASFANPDSMMCEACKVPGCNQCGDSRHVCAVCHEDMYLENGSCVSRYRLRVGVLFTCIGIIAVIFIYYLFALLFLREEVNSKALEAGLNFRHLSSTRNVFRDRRFSLWTNLQKRLINGAGVMLIFRWKFAILVWAVCGTVLYLIAGMYFWGSCYNVHAVNSRRSYDACESNVKLQVSNFNTMEIAYIGLTMIMYLFTFIGSLWFAVAQRRFYQAQDQENTTMKDFALLVKGFPTYGGSKQIEELHVNWFKEQPQFKGLDIVGVSECWNFQDKQDVIHDQVRREFDIYSMKDDVAYAEATSKALESQHEKSRTCIAVDPKLQCIDAALGIGNFPCAGTADEEQPESEDVKKMLEGLKSTGNLFLVMGTTTDRNEAFRRCSQEPMICKHDGFDHHIVVEETMNEPHTVMWKGFGTPRWQFMVRVVIGCILVFTCTLILDVFFYAPYVIYILSCSDVSGMSQGGFVSGLLLGLLITVCNQIIYMIIGKVADKCGWTNSDSKDCFYCVKYTLAVWFNTVIDLGTVLILAQGYSVDMAMQMQVASDSTMSAKAVAESPNIQKALYVQLVAYIFPSCTLLPFLLEPLGGTVLPYLIGKSLIRSRSEVTAQDAEECLQHPPFDLARYGDVLVNMMLCCMTMCFSYCTLWQLYFYMILSVLVIYAWDHVRVLRFSSKTVFATNQMDTSVMYLMALPCAVLLTCGVFKAYGASHQGMLSVLQKQKDGHFGLSPDRYNIFGYLVLAFFGHIVLHWILLKYVVIPKADKRDALEDEGQEPPYTDVGSQRPANFFNTNPVNCLRSKYIYKQEPPCVFYRLGKEHLIQKNESIGIYFEGKPHVEDEVDYKVVQSDDDMKDKLTKHVGNLKGNLSRFADGD